MPTLNEVQTWKGLDLRDNDGDKIGSITDVYLDRQTGEPAWIAVKTGLFGMSSSLVPVSGAQPTTEGVTVPYEKAKVKDAPNVVADGELTPDEERRLYDHYGVAFGDFDYDSDYGVPNRDVGEHTSRARLRRMVP